MSANELRKHRGRWLLPLGLLGLLLAVGVLVGKGLMAQAGIVEHLLVVDRATGVLEIESPQQRWMAFYAHYGALLDIYVPASLAALLALLLIALGVWRRDRARPLGLLRMVLPLLATLSIGLGASLLFHNSFHDRLVDIHQLVSAEPVRWGSDGLCSSWLEPCSRLVAGETLRALAFGGLALVVLALIPAARAAWRAGAQGHRLGWGWSVAAWLCFLGGAAALVATRPHRVDVENTLAICAQQDHRFDSWDRRWRPVTNLSPSELQVRRVESCESADWVEYAETFGEGANIAEGYQLFADGRISSLTLPRGWLASVDRPSDRAPLTDKELAKRLAESVDEASFHGWEVVPPVILLYIDERSSIARLDRVLTLAHQAGIGGVVLVGETFIADELAAAGAWQHRVHCPFGRLRFSNEGQPLAEFESAAELASSAASRGVDGLAIVPDPSSPVQLERRRVEIGR